MDGWMDGEEEGKKRRGGREEGEGRGGRAARKEREGREEGEDDGPWLWPDQRTAVTCTPPER